jgi:hypothetical protein
MFLAKYIFMAFFIFILSSRYLGTATQSSTSVNIVKYRKLILLEAWLGMYRAFIGLCQAFYCIIPPD